MSRYQNNAVNAFLERLAEQQRRLAARGRDLKPVDALTPAQFNRRIRAKMPPQVEELPLADQLLRNERTRALVGNRLDRLTPEQRERSLPAISRAYEDYQRQARMGEEAARLQRNSMLSDAAVPLAAALGAGGALMAGSTPEGEEAPAPMTLDDVQWMTMAPADAMPTSMDLGDPLPVEPEVYIDAEDVDTDGLAEMILAAQETPVIPDVDAMMDEDIGMDLYGSSEPEDYDPILTSFAADPTDYLELRGAGVPVLPDIDDEVPGGPVPVPEVPAMKEARLPDVADYFGEPTQLAAPDRDPYMTNAQKRTVQVLMNAGIPSQRAGRIARGEASLSPQEYRMVTGGRR